MLVLSLTVVLSALLGGCAEPGGARECGVRGYHSAAAVLAELGPHKRCEKMAGCAGAGVTAPPPKLFKHQVDIFELGMSPNLCLDLK